MLVGCASFHTLIRFIALLNIHFHYSFVVQLSHFVSKLCCLVVLLFIQSHYARSLIFHFIQLIIPLSVSHHKLVHLSLFISFSVLLSLPPSMCNVSLIFIFNNILFSIIFKLVIHVLVHLTFIKKIQKHIFYLVY